MDIKFTDNSEQILSASSRARQKALFAIGVSAEGHTKEIITAEDRVDTGRLRNSIAFATVGKDGRTISYDSKTDTEQEQTVSNSDPDSVVIGTNVDYALPNELGTRHMRGIHFLQRSVTENTGEYKQLAEEAYKSEKI